MNQPNIHPAFRGSGGSTAIIGTGIAGMGCGHFLHPSTNLTIYEQNDYVGGHTNTVTVDEDGKPVYIDTGLWCSIIKLTLTCAGFSKR